MKAAVLGATGFVGRALVPELAERMDVIAVSRSGDTPAAEGMQPVSADALEPQSLSLALDGVDVVDYLVHSLGQANFGDVDRRAAKNVAAEAARAGVEQIVFLGGLGADDPNLSEHLRSRAQTARVLADGDVPVTTVRAAVVGYLRDIAGHPDTVGETFDLGGPDVLTYREMIEHIGELRGRRPRIVGCPCSVHAYRRTGCTSSRPSAPTWRGRSSKACATRPSRRTRASERSCHASC
jgi:uncharacterized protein YbjT (DUF2867 family)